MNKIALTEGREIDKIILSLDDQLQKYFLQEDPSTALVDGSLSCHWKGEERLKDIHIDVQIAMPLAL